MFLSGSNCLRRLASCCSVVADCCVFDCLWELKQGLQTLVAGGDRWLVDGDDGDRCRVFGDRWRKERRLSFGASVTRSMVDGAGSRSIDAPEEPSNEPSSVPRSSSEKIVVL